MSVNIPELLSLSQVARRLDCAPNGLGGRLQSVGINPDFTSKAAILFRAERMPEISAAIGGAR